MTMIKDDSFLRALCQVTVTLINSWMRTLQLPVSQAETGGRKFCVIKYKREILFSLGLRDVNWTVKAQVSLLSSSQWAKNIVTLSCHMEFVSKFFKDFLKKKKKEKSFSKNSVFPWQSTQYIHTRSFPVLSSL